MTAPRMPLIDMASLDLVGAERKVRNVESDIRPARRRRRRKRVLARSLEVLGWLLVAAMLLGAGAVMGAAYVQVLR